MADSAQGNSWVDLAARDGVLIAQAHGEPVAEPHATDSHGAAGDAHDAAADMHAVAAGSADEHGADVHAATQGDEHGADEHGADAHGSQAHGDDHHAADAYAMPHELPHIGMLIEAVFNKDFVSHHPGVRPHPSTAFWINPLFTIFFGVIIVTLLRRAFRNASVRKPGKGQMFAELFLGGVRNFFNDILGPGGDKHIPFFGSMWLFILMNNLGVLVPLGKSPTASIKLTFMCAITTMLYARLQNLKEGGVMGYLYHLAGSPRDAVTWMLAPVMFVIEAVGELTKTLSLGLRLFGATMGEDKLLAVFLGLGMMISSVLLHDPSPIIGLPLHLPFFALLVPLMGTIQATILTLLGAIFMQLMMPHDHDHDHDDHGHDAQVHAAGSSVESLTHPH